MENNFSKLRKTTFGGFNKKDVIAYIEKIKNESYEYKSRVEKTVKELETQIAELNAAATEALAEREELIRQIGELTSGELTVVGKESQNETVSEINEATSHLKNVADELCQSLREFMERISENSISVVLEGNGEETEDDFDGEKLMAELEAEIYAKLGVEESEEVTAEELSEAAQVGSDDEDKKDDKVVSILSAVSSFSSTGCKSEDVSSPEPEAKAEKKDETVSNILGSLSFLK